MLLFLACTTGGDSPADTQDTEVDSTDPATVELAGECPMAIDHGGFLVAAYTDYSIVDGRFADSVLQQAEALKSDIILISRADRPFISRILFGSDADKVARLARRDGLGKVIINDD